MPYRVLWLSTTHRFTHSTKYLIFYRDPALTAVNHPFIFQRTRTIFNAFVSHLIAHQQLSCSRFGYHVCPPASLTLIHRESTSSSCQVVSQKSSLSRSITNKDDASLSSPNRSMTFKGKYKAEEVDITPPDFKGPSSHFAVPASLRDHFPSLAPLYYRNDKCTHL